MRTEIFATFGPSCGSKQVLKDMIRAGMTGIRLNLSHTTLSQSESYLYAYKKAAEETGITPQILIDMQGPELRVGVLTSPLSLQKGQIVSFGGTGIPVPRQVLASAEAGDQLLLDDGKIHMNVIACSTNSMQAEVIQSGLLYSHKSIKIHHKNVRMPVLTKHDVENIKLAKTYGITALMQPFVLNGDDLNYVRRILNENHAEDLKIFAKIENRIGMENLETIIPKADVIVIARGDLGNDMPLWELPVIQKKIESTCRQYGKPWIVVTQMLASMESSPVPTRAEVSDIFHAVLHGAYGVMITGESAIGSYPIEAVKYLKNTAAEAEKFADSIID